MKRDSAAFTLLEVMAAVAIVAIVFTTLARVANEGLRSQGVSKRRLEASLIADHEVSKFDFQFGIGNVAPEIGESTSEQDQFSITISVTPFDVASAIPEGGFGDTDPEKKATFTGVLGDDVSPVRAIEIAVTWQEGADEYRVIRNTFGIDRAALQSITDAASQGLTPPEDAPSS